MKFGWQTEREKMERQIHIPAKSRLDWLEKMHDLTQELHPPARRKEWYAMREQRR